MADPSGAGLSGDTKVAADPPPAGPVLHEKSDSMHAAIPPPSPPASSRRNKKKFAALRRFFCCRSSTVLQEPLNVKSNRHVEEISRTSSIANGPPGTSGSVTQQIVLAPEEKVQQQIAAAVAATAVAQAGGDEIAQQEAARLTGDIEPQYLLPQMSAEHASRKCLVLDLDETLVHSSFKLIAQADYVVPVEIENQVHNVYVLKRPGVDEFMRQVGEHFEIVVFTASLAKYADPVLDLLDMHKVVHHRLFRESCLNYKGNYVKDLSQLGRDLRSTMIIDNSPASYILHPSNAVPVTSWFSDPHDTELLDMIPFLVDLATVDDVTQVLDGTQDDESYELNEQLEEFDETEANGETL